MYAASEAEFRWRSRPKHIMESAFSSTMIYFRRIVKTAGNTWTCSHWVRRSWLRYKKVFLKIWALQQTPSPYNALYLHQQKADDMEHLEVFDCSNILIACYFNDDRGCAHENREHTLIYLCSGELEIEERGKKTVLHPGECAFMRRDNRMWLHKKVENGKP